MIKNLKRIGDSAIKLYFGPDAHADVMKFRKNGKHFEYFVGDGRLYSRMTKLGCQYFGDDYSKDAYNVWCNQSKDFIAVWYTNDKKPYYIPRYNINL